MAEKALEGYYKKAIADQQKIEELEKRLAELEAAYAQQQRSGGEAQSGTAKNEGKSAEEVTVIEFPDETEAKDFVQKQEKWWLWGNTWNARLEGAKLIVKAYSPLSDAEYAAFKSSRDAVPSKQCRFDQFYSKQNLFEKLKVNITTQTLSSASFASNKKVVFLQDPPKEILPNNKGRNILITSALPYVNNTPHLGNIVGSVLSADVFSRYCKARGYNSLFICGTDEYGTATETKAIQEGLTPRQICDKYNKIHETVYKWFDIKFDHFGRTSTQAQTEITQDIFLKLQKNGFVNEGSMDQLFCEKCQRFLADRYVEGTCNKCGFEDARGDQCDKCGQLINATELINPRCKLCSSRPVVRSSKHIFLDLTKLTGQLEDWIGKASVKGQWDQNAIGITNAWLREGLKPRCITRDLKWGTPVPVKGYEDKVFYVWFDAPIGYISITANYTKQWEKWWKNPEHVDLYQFMGKDNIPFHTVMFPSSLLGTGDPYTLLHHVSTTEYLNYEGGKFSKSRGIGVFGTDAIDSGIPSEVWRFYLLINRPETSDSSFVWDDFQSKNNNELIANLGNFVNRAISFTKNQFKGVVPPFHKSEPIDEKLVADVNSSLTKYIAALEKVQLKEGLKVAMHISDLGNSYLQHNKHWDLFKTDLTRCESVVHVAVNLTRLLGTIIEPYMPGFHDKVFQQLNWKKQLLTDTFTLDIPAGHVIGPQFILFEKLEPARIQELHERYGGALSKTPKAATNSNGTPPATNTGVTFPPDLRGGEIQTVDDHPSDDGLYVLKVKVGSSEVRQVVGRLKKLYPNKADLIGKPAVVLCNLPPADLKGVQSQAMLLVSESKKASQLLQPKTLPPNWPGTKVIAQGAAQHPFPTISLAEFQKLDLKFKDGQVIFAKQHPLVTENGIPIIATVEGSGKIK